MKKLFIALTLFVSVAAAAVFAQVAKDKTKYPYQEANISYTNVQIYKILDHKDAYIVIYPKSGMNVGQVSIPKKWYKDNPKKLRMRILPKGMQAYMSVFSKEGNFDYVLLTVPTNRTHEVWGVADSNLVINDADKDSLTVEF